MPDSVSPSCTAREFETRTADDVVAQLQRTIGDRPLYVSIDIDVLDPAHAPATGTPEAGGMTSRELLAILRGLDGLDLVGADVVEVSPAYDHAEITGVAAANVAYELISLLGQRGARHDRPAEPVAWPGGAGVRRRSASTSTRSRRCWPSIHGHADRMSAISHQAYGPLVGVPRMLKILAKHGITSTFFVPGYTALRYPGRDPQHRRPRATRSPTTAICTRRWRGLIGRAGGRHPRPRRSRCSRRVTGVRPTGYRAPMWELNWHSPKLLRDRGFLYDS